MITRNEKSSDEVKSHYNDWPNAVGFDAAYEEHEPIELTVQGRIPAYASGKLFRTGIGPRSVPVKNGPGSLKTNHWFDAFAQVHRFELHKPVSSGPDAGIERITYNSRLTCDKMMQQVQKTGKFEHYSFAAKYEPCKSFFKKLQSVFTKDPDPQADGVINAVTISSNYPGLTSKGDSQHAPHDPSKLVTLCNKTDTARLQFLDPDTLEPVGLAMPTKLDPKLKGILSGAHAETDPVTGDVFNYNLDFTAPQNTFHIFRISAATGKTSVLTTFKHDGTYIHSIFMTEHFVVLCMWNSRFLKHGMSILWNRNLLDSMWFDKDSPATWFVVDRRCPQTEGGQGLVAKFESDTPFFAFHSINAFEEASTTTEGAVDLLCDVCAYKNMDILHHFYMDNIVSSHPTAHATAIENARTGKYKDIETNMQRFRLPGVSLPAAATTNVSKAILDYTAPTESSMELPTMNFALHSRPYRYVYGVQMTYDGTKSTFVDGLMKFDWKTRSATAKWSVQGQTPGEPVFVPNPDAKPDSEEGEDDGVLLTVVLDGFSGKSYLLCLSAKDLTEMGRAEVRGPIGFGFHGLFSKF